jgi:3-oxoacyl-[acyl-carrier protein] reductase
MARSLAGKIVAITGGARGIGAATAAALVREGATVAIGDLDLAVAEATAAKLGATAFALDVTDRAGFTKFLEEIEGRLGPLDVLVNNAGIMPLSSVATTDDATFDRTVAINLKGTFNGLREAAKRLRDGGRIINMSSSQASMLFPTYGVYAATKAGVEAMTHVMSKELRGRNITVNAVAPGPTATKLFLDGKPQEVIDHLSKLAPLERLGRPEDVANTIAFLVGPDGGWINGQVLRANGGII